MRSITMSLPVRNPGVSRWFFTELGFSFCPEMSGPDSACVVIDDNVRVLLVAEDRFRDQVNCDMDEAGSCGRVLISLSASSRREVDEVVMRAIVAGAKPWPLVDDGHGYSGSFQDPDGHLWRISCPPSPAELADAVPAARAASGGSTMVM